MTYFFSTVRAFAHKMRIPLRLRLSLVTIATTCVATVCMTGCGNKGPLILPPPPAAPTMTPAPPATDTTTAPATNQNVGNEASAKPAPSQNVSPAKDTQ